MSSEYWQPRDGPHYKILVRMQHKVYMRRKKYMKPGRRRREYADYVYGRGYYNRKWWFSGEDPTMDYMKKMDPTHSDNKHKKPGEAIREDPPKDNSKKRDRDDDDNDKSIDPLAGFPGDTRMIGIKKRAVEPQEIALGGAAAAGIIEGERRSGILRRGVRAVARTVASHFGELANPNRKTISEGISYEELPQEIGGPPERGAIYLDYGPETELTGEGPLEPLYQSDGPVEDRALTIEDLETSLPSERDLLRAYDGLELETSLPSERYLRAYDGLEFSTKDLDQSEALSRSAAESRERVKADLAELKQRIEAVSSRTRSALAASRLEQEPVSARTRAGLQSAARMRDLAAARGRLLGGSPEDEIIQQKGEILMEKETRPGFTSEEKQLAKIAKAVDDGAFQSDLFKLIDSETGKLIGAEVYMNKDLTQQVRLKDFEPGTHKRVLVVLGNENGSVKFKGDVKAIQNGIMDFVHERATTSPVQINHLVTTGDGIRGVVRGLIKANKDRIKSEVTRNEEVAKVIDASDPASIRNRRLLLDNIDRTLIPKIEKLTAIAPPREIGLHKANGRKLKFPDSMIYDDPVFLNEVNDKHAEFSDAGEHGKRVRHVNVESAGSNISQKRIPIFQSIAENEFPTVPEEIIGAPPEEGAPHWTDEYAKLLEDHFDNLSAPELTGESATALAAFQDAASDFTRNRTRQATRDGATVEGFLEFERRIASQKPVSGASVSSHTENLWNKAATESVLPQDPLHEFHNLMQNSFREEVSFTAAEPIKEFIQKNPNATLSDYAMRVQAKGEELGKARRGVLSFFHPDDRDKIFEEGDTLKVGEGETLKEITNIEEYKASGLKPLAGSYTMDRFGLEWLRAGGKLTNREYLYLDAPEFWRDQPAHTALGSENIWDGDKRHVLEQKLAERRNSEAQYKFEQYHGDQPFLKMVAGDYRNLLSHINEGKIDAAEALEKLSDDPTKHAITTESLQEMSDTYHRNYGFSPEAVSEPVYETSRFGSSVSEGFNNFKSSASERFGRFGSSVNEGFGKFRTAVSDAATRFGQSSVGTTLKGAIHPGYLGTGLASAYLANKALNFADTNFGWHLGTAPRAIAEGGLMGALNWGGLSALNLESAGLLPELGAGAAFMGARLGAQKLLGAAGLSENNFFSEVLSDAAGGATAGALLGGAPGAAVGGLFGAGFGAISRGVSSLFS